MYPLVDVDSTAGYRARHKLSNGSPILKPIKGTKEFGQAVGLKQLSKAHFYTQQLGHGMSQVL